MELRQVLKMYLDLQSQKDTEFATAYANKNKSLDECLLYIQKTMYDKVMEMSKKKKERSACIMPSDDEIFALAVKYYMDADLKVSGTSFDNVKILSMCATSFTDEEKEKMRKEAIKKYQDDVVSEAKKRDEERKNKKAKKPSNPVIVPDVGENKEEKKENPKQKAQQLSLLF